ncbi:MAG: translation initiation factor IF-2 [Candidatus Bipolaricaulota bacterium]|nr:MAG: translation initiation factor IF-2 [Candidatus Bipolaricaulota bacterium]
MTRRRIYEIARELDVTSKEFVTRLGELGMPGLKASNTVDEEEYALIVNLYTDEGAAEPTAEAAEEAPPAEVRPRERRTRVTTGDPRAPVVSVLGHIDHGKTTLLDALRSSQLVEKEAGGITQGVAAYQVDLRGQKITVIDTPGHKAFTGMRARGAQATDIAILVVAADDGVMAQTVEAIDHIRAADIPMIVAVNKIDKANADVDRVMGDLAKQGLTPEAWGGDTVTVPISALNGENLEELMEMILLVAEMEDLRGDPDAALEAVIIESHLSAGRGPVASVVVRNGTLREKDIIVADQTYGRVKALIDGSGTRCAEATPGTAVEVLGLQEVPAVGSTLEVLSKINEAKRLAERRRSEAESPRRSRAQLSVEDLFKEAQEEEKLRLILKAGSTGALEAVRREIEALQVGEIEKEILLTGVGAVSESDILLASSVSGPCLVVGFGVKADGKATQLADRNGVIVMTYEIIYDLIEQIEGTLKRMLAPEFREVSLGTAEVRDIFKIPVGVVAGCYIAEGRVQRSAKARLLRDGEELFVGEIASLRRFEDDVREVQSGRECGIRLAEFDDVQIGDRLEFFLLEEVPA